MTNNTSSRILPLEGAYPCAILLSWPHQNTDWSDKIKEVRDYYLQLIEILININVPVIIVGPNLTAIKSHFGDYSDKIILFECDTNDTWTRDFGPITVKEKGEWIICDFKFNGWGLKFAACYDNLVTSKLHRSNLFKAEYENHLGFVLEGGSIESDGNGTIMTTSRCLCSPNRNGNLSKAKIEMYLKKYLGAEQVLWLKYGELQGDDTDAHIDTLARFGIKNRIIYTRCYKDKDSHYTELEKMRIELEGFKNINGDSYELIDLPLPDPIFDNEGNRLPATYANYLITPTHIIMPSYGQSENDEIARKKLMYAYEKDVIQLNSNILITQHGSLHCATMQIPISIINLEG